jgi:hypothetical protein
MEKIIETIGGLAKEEILRSVNENIMPNTMVLEAEEPFPAYHGINIPTEAKPSSAFLVTKKLYSAEKIFRIANIIQKYFQHEFDAVQGRICIHNDVFPCIRIRGLVRYELIGDLQKCFFSEGIEFARKKNLKADALIQLKKLFTITEISDEIYHDLDEHSTYYIRIHKQLSWQNFIHITQNVRNNTSINFDGALAAIYCKNILDVVRIYAPDIDINTLIKLKERYNLEIQKFD